MLDTNLTNIGNSTIEMSRRASIAYMLATTPDTFDMLSKNNINLFHGTNISALPSIMNHGLKSFDELQKDGVDVLTGESFTRKYRKRDFISFTDDLETAIGYSGIPTTSKNSEIDNSFGMIIGISSNDIDSLRPCTVHSDIPEIGIKNNIPLEYIKFIAVPENKVHFVQKLVDDLSITVVPINMDKKFYYMDESEIIFYSEKLEDFIKSDIHKDQTIFCEEDLNEIAKERKIFGITSIYKNIKEKIQGKGKDRKNDSR